MSLTLQRSIPASSPVLPVMLDALMAAQPHRPVQGQTLVFLSPRQTSNLALSKSCQEAVLQAASLFPTCVCSHPYLLLPSLTKPLAWRPLGVLPDPRPKGSPSWFPLQNDEADPCHSNPTVVRPQPSLNRPCFPQGTSPAHPPPHLHARANAVPTTQKFCSVLHLDSPTPCPSLETYSKCPFLHKDFPDLFSMVESESCWAACVWVAGMQSHWRQWDKPSAPSSTVFWLSHWAHYSTSTHVCVLPKSLQ